MVWLGGVVVIFVPESIMLKFLKLEISYAHRFDKNLF